MFIINQEQGLIARDAVNTNLVHVVKTKKSNTKSDYSLSRLDNQVIKWYT